MRAKQNTQMKVLFTKGTEGYHNTSVFTTGYRKNLSVFSHCNEHLLSGNSERQRDREKTFFTHTSGIRWFSAGACLHEAPISVRSQGRRPCRRGMGMSPHQAKMRKRRPGRTAVLQFLTAGGIACRSLSGPRKHCLPRLLHVIRRYYDKRNYERN